MSTITLNGDAQQRAVLIRYIREHFRVSREAASCALGCSEATYRRRERDGFNERKLQTVVRFLERRCNVTIVLGEDHSPPQPENRAKGAYLAISPDPHHGIAEAYTAFFGSATYHTPYTDTPLVPPPSWDEPHEVNKYTKATAWEALHFMWLANPVAVGSDDLKLGPVDTLRAWLEQRGMAYYVGAFKNYRWGPAPYPAISDTEFTNVLAPYIAADPAGPPAVTLIHYDFTNHLDRANIVNLTRAVEETPEERIRAWCRTRRPAHDEDQLLAQLRASGVPDAQLYDILSALDGDCESQLP